MSEQPQLSFWQRFVRWWRGPKDPNETRFKIINDTDEKEAAFDLVAMRHVPRPSGAVGSVAHLVKGALGSGILSAHLSYKHAGLAIGLALNLAAGIYMTYTLYCLVKAAEKLYRRTGITTMTYPEVGEAAVACNHNPKIAKYSKCFRIWMDTVICIDLFGACSSYMLVMAKTLKQLVEDNTNDSAVGIPSTNPHLRVYIAAMCLPVILICMVRHLSWLAPFSLLGNFLIVLCVCVTVYYATQNNPSFSGLSMANDFEGVFTFLGMIVFSMSCSGVVLAIENNMKNTSQFGYVLVSGMVIIVSCIMTCAAFGYGGFGKDSVAPVTSNFPMDTFPKILRGLIIVMIYTTFAINFWVPFNLAFHYIKKRVDPKKEIIWELCMRALFVCMITIIAVAFPAIDALLNFLGCFCLSLMAFMWPCMIELFVIWKRPGLGPGRWRLWKNVFLLFIGSILWSAGSVVSIKQLVNVFIKSAT